MSKLRFWRVFCYDNAVSWHSHSSYQFQQAGNFWWQPEHSQFPCPSQKHVGCKRQGHLHSKSPSYILCDPAATARIPAQYKVHHQHKAHGLTPSLPQPVQFPGWKVHAHACEQYIFRPCNKSNFSTVHLIKIHLHANVKKKTKIVYWFQILHF